MLPDIFPCSDLIMLSEYFSFAVTSEMISPFLEGNTVAEVIQQKKLYMVDLTYLATIECAENRPVGFICQCLTDYIKNSLCIHQRCFLHHHCFYRGYQKIGQHVIIFIALISSVKYLRTQNYRYNTRHGMIGSYQEHMG